MVKFDSDYEDLAPTLISDIRQLAQDFPIAATNVPNGWAGGLITGSGATNGTGDGSANWSVPAAGSHSNRLLFGGTGGSGGAALSRNSYVTRAVAIPAVTIERPQEWAFNVSYDSSTSSDASDNNGFRVWLWADRTNLASANGYMIEYGEAGTTDRLKLYRVTGGSRADLRSF